MDYFGLPKYIRIDKVKGWNLKQVRKYQVIRRTLELYQEDLKQFDLKALKEAAIYVSHAINQLSIMRGFTP